MAMPPVVDGGVMVARSRGRDVVALISALALVAVSVWVVQKIRTSDNPVNTATVYATYVGVATLLVSVLAFLLPWWWKGRRATAVTTSAGRVRAAADQLALSMLDTWRQEASERRISTPAPVRVRWRWGPAEVTPPLVEVITAPVTGTGPPLLPEPNPDPPGVLLEAGFVTRLHEEVYCKLPHGRLVLLGGPGAGKTGAMILLLLAALEYRRSVGGAARGEVPVPVWLTLGGWDPATQTLHQWVVATMYRDHPYLRAPDYGADVVGELLRAGRVALFLDGLDEMAPWAQGRALARIEQEGAGLRLVLSSRPEEYRQALSEDRVYNTAVIEIQPVDPEVSRAYLLHDQIGCQHDRWAQLGDYLTQHPDSIAAQALNNPLTLSLARATYQDQDPAPLTDPAEFPTVAALRTHLIDRTLVIAYPEEPQRAHATQCLAWIAHYLGSGRDLAWWHIPTWIPRWQLGLVFGLVFGGGVGLVFGVVFGLVFGFGVGLVFGFGGGFGLGLGGGLAVALTSELGTEPKVISPRWPRPRELPRRLVVGLAVGFGGLVFGFGFGLVGGLTGGLVGGLTGGVVGFVGGLTGQVVSGVGTEPRAIFPRWPRRRELPKLLAGGLAHGLVFGLVFGLVYGLAVGLVVGLMCELVGGILELLALWTVPLPRTSTATPTTSYRNDRRTSIGVGLAFGLAFGLAIGLIFGLVYGFAAGLMFGFAGGFAVGLARVLMGGSMTVSLTELVLATTGTGRVKFIRVLENAHHHQVLRQAGAVYQFRHAELQDHLADIHRGHIPPPTNT